MRARNRAQPTSTWASRSCVTRPGSRSITCDDAQDAGRAAGRPARVHGHRQRPQPQGAGGHPALRTQPAAYGEGVYVPAWTERSYAELLRRAATLLGNGESVVADASWLSARLAAACQALAGGDRHRRGRPVTRWSRRWRRSVRTDPSTCGCPAGLTCSPAEEVITVTVGARVGDARPERHHDGNPRAAERIKASATPEEIRR